MAQELAGMLEEQGRLDLAECFIDGSFARAKKGVATPDAVRAARDRR